MKLLTQSLWQRYYDMPLVMMRSGVLVKQDRRGPASPGRRGMQHPANDHSSSNSGGYQINKDDLQAQAGGVSPARAGFAPWRPRPTSPMVAELAARQHQQHGPTHRQAPAQKHPAHVSSLSSSRASNQIRTLQLIAQGGKPQPRCNSPSGQPLRLGLEADINHLVVGGLRGATLSPVMGLEGRSVHQSPSRMMAARNSWHGMPSASARQTTMRSSSPWPDENTHHTYNTYNPASPWPRPASSPCSPRSPRPFSERERERERESLTATRSATPNSRHKF
jgi:hypothetical protein